MKRYFRKFLSSIIFSGFGIFTLLFFSPLEVYMGNPNDFRFFIDSALFILGIASLASTLLFSAAVSFLPTKILKVLNLTVFSLGICYYLQALLLNGSLSILTGENFSVATSTVIVNILIWCLIFAVVFASWYIFKKLCKERLYINTVKYIALALIAMQLTGFFSMYISYDKNVNLSKSLYCSTEGQLEVSKNNNVIYFVIDYCDTRFVNDALNEDPSLFEYFNGFTYYEDNVFTHSRTFPAITYMLSGEKCYYDKDYKDYVNDSIRDSEFLNEIDDSGADIRLYTDPKLVGTDSNKLFDNYKKDDKIGANMKIKGFLIQSLKVSGFRGMPYIAKKHFFYDTESVNASSIAQTHDVAPINDDLAFYDSLLSDKVSVNENYSSAFRFYHMFGSHPGATINENAEYMMWVSLSQALRGDLKIIEEYLEQLKSIGAYDDSTIIITADHGEYKGRFDKPQTCLLMVKEAGADTTKPIQISQAQVSHENIFPTIIKAIGNDHTKYGKALDEVSETETVKRYIYNTEVDDETRYETVMKEYLIEGDASDMNNYSATGREWNVNSTVYNN